MISSGTLLLYIIGTLVVIVSPGVHSMGHRVYSGWLGVKSGILEKPVATQKTAR